MQRDVRTLHALGYVPVSHVTVGSGTSSLIVFHSVCSGSADGHCQAVEAFKSGLAGPIWVRQYADVRSLRSTGNGFRITFARYKKSDPLCCPSLPPVTQTFRWDGKHVLAQ